MDTSFQNRQVKSAQRGRMLRPASSLSKKVKLSKEFVGAKQELMTASLFYPSMLVNRP